MRIASDEALGVTHTIPVDEGAEIATAHHIDGTRKIGFVGKDIFGQIIQRKFVGEKGPAQLHEGLDTAIQGGHTGCLFFCILGLEIPVDQSTKGLFLDRGQHQRTPVHLPEISPDIYPQKNKTGNTGQDAGQGFLQERSHKSRKSGEQDQQHGQGTGAIFHASPGRHIPKKGCHPPETPPGSEHRTDKTGQNGNAHHIHGRISPAKHDGRKGKNRRFHLRTDHQPPGFRITGRHQQQGIGQHHHGGRKRKKHPAAQKTGYAAEQGGQGAQDTGERAGSLQAVFHHVKNRQHTETNE